MNSNKEKPLIKTYVGISIQKDQLKGKYLKMRKM